MHAHKLVLSLGSSVFAVMFNSGAFAESRAAASTTAAAAAPRVDVPDVEAAAFRALLAYLYADALELTADNVMAVLYAGEARADGRDDGGRSALANLRRHSLQRASTR